MRNAPRRADAGRHAPHAPPVAPDASPAVDSRIPDVRRRDAAGRTALMDDLALRLRDVRDALPPLGFEVMVRELARARRRLDARAGLTV